MTTPYNENTPPIFEDIRDAAYAQVLFDLLDMVDSGYKDFEVIKMRTMILLLQGGFSARVVNAFESLTNRLWSVIMHQGIEDILARREALSQRAITASRKRRGRPNFAETQEGKRFQADRNKVIEQYRRTHNGQPPPRKELASLLGIALSTLRKRENNLLKHQN